MNAKKYFPYFFAVAAIFFALGVMWTSSQMPAEAAGTLTYKMTAAQALPQFDMFVWTGTLAGGSDTFTIPATFVVDEEDYFYTKSTGNDYTAPLKLRSISGTTYTIEGDSGETYKVIYKDYMDF